MRILVTDFDGTTHVVTGEPGWPLMEAIRAAGLPIKAECGGCCLCSTCHVYVEAGRSAELPAMTDDERMTLADAPEVTGRSRLSCQIHLTPEMDGLAVALAPVL